MGQRFKWRTQNDDPARDEAVGQEAATYNDEPSLTQQQFTPETDLNEIMRQYGVTDRAAEPAAFAPGTLAIDYTHLEGLEYRDVLDRMREAQQAFAQLPADLRRRFNNKPEDLWDFVNDPRNDEEAVKMGLLKRQNSSPNAEPAASTSSAETAAKE